MKITSLYNEAELLAQIVQGSEEAFATLFHYYRDRIYSVAIRLTESTFIAEEVVQDVFLKLWMKRETLMEIRNFEDYLFIMARNHVFSALKRIARQQNLVEELAYELPASENTPHEEFLMQEYDQIMRQAIDLLPAKQKQIYLLSKEQHLKREEISQLLHISPETVKTHLARAMRHIRAYSISRLEMQIAWLLFILTN